MSEWWAALQWPCSCWDLKELLFPRTPGNEQRQPGYTGSSGIWAEQCVCACLVQGIYWRCCPGPSSLTWKWGSLGVDVLADFWVKRKGESVDFITLRSLVKGENQGLNTAWSIENFTTLWAACIDSKLALQEPEKLWMSPGSWTGNLKRKSWLGLTYNRKYSD